MKISQATQATELQRDLRALDARMADLQGTVDRAALEWNPPDGGWSVAQVFEHLCVATDDYLTVLRPLVAGLSSNDQPRADLTWRPSFAGGLLTKSMVSPRKLPAPKAWKPGPAPRPNVMSEFAVRQQELGRLIAESANSEWNRVRLASPVSFLVRMNIGDAFTILVRHAERHFGQINDRLAQFAATRGEAIVAR
jgi:hypothetical protein